MPTASPTCCSWRSSSLEDEEHLLWLEDNPHERCILEARLADGEHCLDIIIGLRAKEILGLAILPEDRPGIRACARIHSAASLEQLAGRLDRLVARYNDIERLARLRASPHPARDRGGARPACRRSPARRRFRDPDDDDSWNRDSDDDFRPNLDDDDDFFRRRRNPRAAVSAHSHTWPRLYLPALPAGMRPHARTTPSGTAAALCPAP